MKFIVNCSLIAFFFANWLPAAGLELGPHPRLFLTARGGDKVPGVAELKERISEPVYKDRWQKMTGSSHAPDRALVYLLSGDTTGLALVRKELDKVAGRYEGIVERSLAYDWAYAAFSVGEREYFAARLMESVAAMNKHYRIPTVYHNMCRGRNMGQGLAMLATWEDAPAARELEPTVRRELEEFLEITGDGVPAGDMLGRAAWGGGWPEGYDYDRHGSHYAMRLLLAWRSCGLGDYFGGSNHWRDKVLYLVHGTGPGGKFILGYEDNDWPFPMPHDRRLMSFLEGELKSGLASWWVDTYADTLQVTPHYWEFLFSDPSVKSVPPGNLHTSHLVPGLGLVLMRSSWRDDATFIHFHCGPFYTYHQQEARGSFSAFRNHWLVLEPGVYNGEVDENNVNWRIRTISHNCITVFDPDEKFHGPDEVPSPANDGGQKINHWIRKPANLAEFRDQSDLRVVGTVTSFLTGASHDYVAGEAGKSYSSDKVSRWARQMVFVKPGWLVLCDLVRSTKSEFAKTLYLHTPGAIALDGAWSSASGLRIWSLLPEGANRRVAGGPGKAFSYGGNDWSGPDAYNGQVDDAWRLEVIAPEALETVYLTVLDLRADDNHGKQRTVRLLENSPGRVAVSLEGGWQVSFDPRAEEPYSLTGPGADYSISGSVLTGGLPAEGAEVTLSGDDGRQNQVTPYHGRFLFTRLAPGDYTLSVNGRSRTLRVGSANLGPIDIDL